MNMKSRMTALPQLLHDLCPHLHEGVYVFASLPEAPPPGGVTAIATFQEAEGLTIIAEEQEALRAKLPILSRAAWITLTVHSDLNAVGFTP